MVQAYRLLVQKLDEEGLKPYPLHLGVTEAGDGEDGRIKSAVGIGTLLEDGLGDTVRVSLTEEPEAEAPVAAQLIARYAQPEKRQQPLNEPAGPLTDPYHYQRRATAEVANFGGQNVPRVIADFSAVQPLEVKDLRAVGHYYLPEPDKWSMTDQGADYLYCGSHSPSFMLPNGLQLLLDYPQWLQHREQPEQLNVAYPLYSVQQWEQAKQRSGTLNLLRLNYHELNEQLLKNIVGQPVVLLVHTDNPHAYAELRLLFYTLLEKGVQLPVVVERDYPEADADAFVLYSATDVGGLLIDGFGDGVLLRHHTAAAATAGERKQVNATAFGILQAARTRMTKTEYISCPSCGRTLFDLQETTAMIRKRTDHLKGVKIGIMGCIVNGPGEMADADYGYVGSGKGKITLYKGQEVVKRNVPSEQAVDELIELIRENGHWVEPTTALAETY